MAIDSHAHYNSLFIKNVDEIMKKIDSDDIEAVINVAINFETSRQITLSLRKHAKIYNAIGIHPLCDDSPEDIYMLYTKRFDSGKIVAIGEIGLDNSASDFERQKRLFISQLEIARYLKLPVIIHARGSNSEVVDIILKNNPQYGYVLHHFEPDMNMIMELVKNEGYISIGSSILNENNHQLIDIVKWVPITRLLVETNGPYFEHTNKIIELRPIMERIAQIRQMEYHQINQVTTSNTKRLFKKIH